MWSTASEPGLREGISTYYNNEYSTVENTAETIIKREISHQKLRETATLDFETEFAIKKVDSF